jgi:sterol desaturase/sphingolipid hydroxylase (fatty acid hydroxylase superfamily)
MLLIHMGPTEFIYYWLHRALHLHSLYARYHSHHHASFVPEAITGSVHPFMEHLMYTANFAIPLVGTWMAGGASIAMFYMYLLGFDLMNIIGHCNFEFFPVWPFQARTTLSLSLALLLRLRACICSTSARALC